MKGQNYTQAEAVTIINDNFIKQMIQEQDKYMNKRDLSSIQKLLKFYTDCIHFFECKDQLMGFYFKCKIMQIVKRMERSKELQRKKQKRQLQLSSSVKQLSQSMTQKQIVTQALQKQKNQLQMIRTMIKQQEQRLMHRIERKHKKSLNESITINERDQKPQQQPQDQDKFIQMLVQNCLKINQQHQKILSQSIVFSEDQTLYTFFNFCLTSTNKGQGCEEKQTELNFI